MAEIAKSGTPSLSSDNPPQNDQLNGIAGEPIAAGDMVYIKNDSRMWRTSGAAVGPAALAVGMAAEPGGVGEPITAHHNNTYKYGAALTPGDRYYLSGTVPGGLANVATTGGTAPVAFAIDATRIKVLPITR